MNKFIFLFLLLIGTGGLLASKGIFKKNFRPEELQSDTLVHQGAEAIGIDGVALQKKIDAIVQEALVKEATPGAVVLVAKEHRILVEKAYGYKTYSKTDPVRTGDVFDLASISKIASTTLATMHLVETGALDLEARLSTYLPETKNMDKGDLQIRSILLHEAGLIPFIPFHQKIKHDAHAKDSSATFPTKVAPGYYVRKGYFKEVMWPEMLASPLTPEPGYVYSDLSMYFMQQVIERITQTPLDKYINDLVYKKLGLLHTGYNPWKTEDSEILVPTEQDGPSFRNALLVGYVHDQGAALAGGVAGHAGLFSNAKELAILGQMLLNGGKYNGHQYFKAETVNLFTSSQSSISRRGLGFDRVEPDRRKEYPSALASSSTYGHTGYTGTAIWIDPEHQLIYIFLSNRVHPKVSNRLLDLNIRSRILDAVYEEIEKSTQRN